VILRDPRAPLVQGLTTAATVWVTAALALTCGLGDRRTGATGVAIARPATADCRLHGLKINLAVSRIAARASASPSIMSAGFGAAGGRPMDRMVEYCWRMAAEYTRRAEETTDREVREFFYRMRDNWAKTAHRQEMLGDAGPRFAGAQDADPPPPRVSEAP